MTVPEWSAAWSTDRGGLRLAGLFDRPVVATLEVRLASGSWAPTAPVHADDGSWHFESDGAALQLGARPWQGGVRFDWSLRPGADIALEQVIPLRFGPDCPILADLGRTTAFYQGYQSWTPSRAVPADHVVRRPWLRTLERMTFAVDSPYHGRKDGFASDGVLVLRRQGDAEAILVGFLSARAGHGEIFVRREGERQIEASLSYGGKRCRRGEVVRGESLWVARGNAEALLARWAALVAAECGARVRETPSPLGWCSWYEYYTKVREQDVRANLAFLAARPHLGVQVVQLDDGYQTAVGDWLSFNRKFPAGVAPLAAAVHEHGFQAGIWTAPFFASNRSQGLREHPERFLRDAQGHLVDCGFNPLWFTRAKALDLTHPQTLAWLGQVYGALVAAGYDFFKIDFLFAGLRRGRFHDPSYSPVEAYRAGLTAIREAIGPDRFLLGCGAPILPSVGFFDAMRVSQDVKEAWDDPVFSRIGPGSAYPAARGALRNTLTRSFLHRRFWLNDPDCVLVRDRNTKLDLDETRTLVTLMGMSGGMLFLSDDLSRLNPERLALAERVLPPGPLTAHPQDLLADAWPNDVRLDGADRRLVALVNWADRPETRAVPRAPDETVFDFWAERIEVCDRIEIARHGVRALVCTPRCPVPHVVGTTLHLVAPIDGRFRDAFEAGALVLRGQRMARTRGRVWIRVPPGFTVGKFPPGVRDAGAWGQGILVDLEPAVREDGSWELRIPFSQGGVR